MAAAAPPLHAFLFSRASGTSLSVLLGFAAIVGSFVNSYTADKYDGLMAQRLQGATYFRLGRDVRVFFVFLGALLNLPLVTIDATLDHDVTFADEISCDRDSARDHGVAGARAVRS